MPHKKKRILDSRNNIASSYISAFWYLQPKGGWVGDFFLQGGYLLQFDKVEKASGWGTEGARVMKEGIII